MPKIDNLNFNFLQWKDFNFKVKIDQIFKYEIQSFNAKNLYLCGDSGKYCSVHSIYLESRKNFFPKVAKHRCNDP